MPTEISGSTGVNKIQDNTIVNADINSSAAIAGSKLVMPTGSVLQVVYGTTNSEISTSSSSYVATNLEATITPSSSSSKILVTYSGTFYHYLNVAVSSTVYRGSTDIASVGTSIGVMRSWLPSSRGYFLHQGQLLDSPNTTSATTYKVYVKKNSGEYTIDFPTSAANTFPSITLMEIAG